MENSPAVRVLLIDDDHDGANSTAMLLRHFGAEARTVYDARLACEEARSFEPDLMLIDLSMPHLDGCEIARQLRGTKQFKTTPLVVVSGHTDSEQRTLCTAAGFDEYLVKPARLEQLMELLANARAAKAIAQEGSGRANHDTRQEATTFEVTTE